VPPSLPITSRQLPQPLSSSSSSSHHQSSIKPPAVLPVPDESSTAAAARCPALLPSRQWTIPAGELETTSLPGSAADTTTSSSSSSSAAKAVDPLGQLDRALNNIILAPSACHLQPQHQAAAAASMCRSGPVTGAANAAAAHARGHNPQQLQPAAPEEEHQQGQPQRSSTSSVPSAVTTILSECDWQRELEGAVTAGTAAACAQRESSRRLPRVLQINPSRFQHSSRAVALSSYLPHPELHMARATALWVATRAAA